MIREVCVASLTLSELRTHDIITIRRSLNVRSLCQMLHCWNWANMGVCARSDGWRSIRDTNAMTYLIRMTYVRSLASSYQDMNVCKISIPSACKDTWALCPHHRWNKPWHCGGVLFDQLPPSGLQRHVRMLQGFQAAAEELRHPQFLHNLLWSAALHRLQKLLVLVRLRFLVEQVQHQLRKQTPSTAAEVQLFARCVLEHHERR